MFKEDMIYDRERTSVILALSVASGTGIGLQIFT